MAEQALQEAGGDKDEAARLLKKRIEENRVIADIVLGGLLDDEVWRLISRAQRVVRRHSVIMGGRHPVVPSEAVETTETEAEEDEENLTVLGLKLKGERVFLEMMLSIGITLGRAKRKDLEREIAEIEHAVEWNKKRVAWLRAIAAKVTDGGRVEDVLSEDDLRAMRDATR
jgi:hypothetical protein